MHYSWQYWQQCYFGFPGLCYNRLLLSNKQYFYKKYSIAFSLNLGYLYCVKISLLINKKLIPVLAVIILLTLFNSKVFSSNNLSLLGSYQSCYFEIGNAILNPILENSSAKTNLKLLTKLYSNHFYSRNYHTKIFLLFFNCDSENNLSLSL